MNLTIGNDVALAFALLFAGLWGDERASTCSGVSMPVRVRILLAALVAAALMPLASVGMPSASGIGPIVILMVREVAVGLILSFAASISVKWVRL